MPAAHVFVDTNVFVYARQAREVEKQPIAAQWIDRLWREQTGRTSMQVLSECYVTLMRRLEPAPPRAIAWDYVRSLLAWSPQPIDDSVLRQAFEIEERHRLSWWDCLIVGSAQLQDCSVLLTGDLQDGAAFGGLTVRSPFALGVSDDLAAYVPAGLEPPPTRAADGPRGRARGFLRRNDWRENTFRPERSWAAVQNRFPRRRFFSGLSPEPLLQEPQERLQLRQQVPPGLVHGIDG